MDDLKRSYEAAVEALPPGLKWKACDLRSGTVDGGQTWEIRDASGVLLNPPAPPDPAPERQPAASGLIQGERSLLLAVARKANDLDALVAEVVDAVAVRLKSLEAGQVAKSLDAEAIDAVAEMVGRLESLERRLTEAPIRHRGYWRDGMQAERGDTFTHEGSLWWAQRATTAKPCHEHKLDWLLMARKGRDARQNDD